MNEKFATLGHNKTSITNSLKPIGQVAANSQMIQRRKGPMSIQMGMTSYNCYSHMIRRRKVPMSIQMGMASYNAIVT